MNPNVSSMRPLYKQVFNVKSMLFYLLVSACVLSLLFVLATRVDQWNLWIPGLLVIAAWTPLIVLITRRIYRQDPWLAFAYVLVVTQTAHTIEHMAQMVELHLMGLPGPKANGIIGFLNVEWVHLIWNSAILVAALMLLFVYWRNVWLWMLFVFAIYHEAEHVYIVSVYVQTQRLGIPGLLAKGGVIGGGLPIPRPDLHAIYAIFELALVVVIYFVERRKFVLTQQAGTVARLAV
jgi:hypothetical protein